MQPWIDLLREDFERGFAEVLRYDEMTFRHYLRTVALWPHEVIDFVELVMSQTNQYDQSFTDLMMQTLHFNTPDWATVKGGLSRITDSAANVLGQDNILRNAPVKEIRETIEGKVELVAGDIVLQKRTFDKIILTVPPASIQNIRIRPQWSPLKERAIMTSHEGPLYKMGVHFRTRFWEQTSEPCFGGQTQTDLRVRWIVYPSNDPGWMAREQRVKLVLEDLDAFFSKQGVNVYDQLIDAFDVHWPSEVGGGNTMYLPGQFSKFHEPLKQPEGNVFFAGEHISRHHTWVAGAVESAHYAVEQVLAQQTRPLGLSKAPSTAPVELGPETARGVFIDFGPSIDTPARSPDIEDIAFDTAIKVQSGVETSLPVAKHGPAPEIFVPRVLQEIQVQ
ncbi:hypothetical protein DL771_005421 [Monosporascus sp. 5C6A]|nr:hypothetical protein DL771_005421 [Monosporascus sp. 5C6A]